MFTLLVGLCGGVAAGGTLLFLAHLAPRVAAGTFVRDMEEVCVWGRPCSSREARLIGVALHLLLSGLFGFVFALGVAEELVTGYQFVPLAVYAVVLTIVMGGVVVPLEGHGLFGVKADRWFPLDLLITNLLWVVLYGLFMGALT